MTSRLDTTPARSSTRRRTRCTAIAALAVVVLVAAVAAGYATALVDNPGILAALIAAATVGASRDRRHCRRR